MAAIRELGEREGLTGILVRGSGIAFLIQTSGTGIGYLVQVLLARWIGPEGYGSYVFVFTWAQTLALLCLMGMDVAVLRFIPEYLEQRKPGHLRGLLRWTRWIVLSMAVAAAGGVGWLALIANRLTPADAMVTAGCLLVPVLAEMELHTQLLRSARRVTAAYLPTLILWPLAVVAGVSGIQRLMEIPGGQSAVWAVLLSGCGILVLQAVLVARVFRVETRGQAPVFDGRTWLTVAAPMYLITIFSTLLMRADTLLVGFFLGAEDVGLYSVAMKTAAIVSFPLMAANTMAAPLVAAQYARRETSSLQEVVRVATLGSFAAAFILGLGILLFGEPVLSLFGPEFVQARWVMTVLVIGQLINVGTGPVGVLLMLTGHERWCLAVFAVTSLGHVLLCLWWIPVFGMLGAAVVSTLALAVWNIWLLALARRKLGIRADVLSAAKMTLDGFARRRDET